MNALQTQVYAHAQAAGTGLDPAHCRLAARIAEATEGQLRAALKVYTPHEIKSALTEEVR